MAMTAERECERSGVAPGMEDHDQDLFDDLSRRLDCLWRYDQYLANAGDRAELQEFWRGAKSQEQRNIDQLRKLIKQHIQSNGFAALMNART